MSEVAATASLAANGTDRRLEASMEEAGDERDALVEVEGRLIPRRRRVAVAYAETVSCRRYRLLGMLRTLRPVR